VNAYSRQLAYAKAINKKGSPWMIDHPFDQKRKDMGNEVADFVQKKRTKDQISEPIGKRVIETLEKVENKSI
jgi:hypothetical protein